MLSPRRRVLVAVLAAAVLVAPVAGCGSSKPKVIEPKAFVDKLTKAIGTKHTAKVELELGSSISATADVEYAGADTSMSIKMATGPSTVNVVIVKDAMYLQQTKGSKYLKIDKSDPALGSLLGQVGGFGPKSAIESLKPGVTKVRDKGKETVDGVVLEHYVLSVDTKKATSIFGVPQGSAKTPAKVTYDIWIDGDDLLRQMKTTVSGQKLVMKLSDWGKPVTITVPPASEVMTR